MNEEDNIKRVGPQPVPALAPVSHLMTYTFAPYVGEALEARRRRGAGPEERRLQPAEEGRIFTFAYSTDWRIVTE